ncbi:[protein-PII] uridylyltransferase [Advenella sp. FME57]|uniref:[protein-PII] uridylyltransferase n=1 Tax=Advenella sp. FME57 TaxID=2742604 RepID=UPI00186609C7|nr:[protein-PII] uridylyltransferase [Advenella sp. FME57]
MNTVSPATAIRNRLQAQKTQAVDNYRQHRSRPDSLLAALRKHTDQAMKELAASFPLPAGASLCAIGGYGRGELFPYSDIDLLILLQRPPEDGDKALLEQFVSSLWDLGLDIGHSVRTIDECLSESAADITIETGLLELRFILGNRKLVSALEARFREQLNPQDFFLAKQLELQQRYARYSETPYSLEPNCKESPGGLRDLQMIRWISLAAGLSGTWRDLVTHDMMTRDEAAKCAKSEQAFKRLRIDLHLLAGKRDDRLMFHNQPLLAEVYRIKATDTRRPSEILMQRYYWAARIVYLMNHIMMQSFREYFFPVKDCSVMIDEDFCRVGQQLDLVADDAFERKPQLLLKAFLVLQQHPEVNDMSAKLQRQIWSSRHRIDAQFRRNPVNKWLFLQILQQPTGIVHSFRRMTMLSILPQYIPVFRKIVGQMQHDLFHVYTVDQHTLMVIRNIRRFTMPEHAQEYPLASRLIADMDQHWLLYVAALFHDIAKGRGGNHSTLGALEVRKFARDHNLDPQDRALVEFLVVHHLTMSAFAQKRDLSEPSVIQEFADIVGTERRLTALYLLTVADIRGTSPKVWNAWKGKLLEDLYHYTLTALGTNVFDRQSVLTQRKNDAIALVRFSGISDEDRDRFWNTLDVAYFLRHEARDIAWHTRLLYRMLPQVGAQVRARPTENNEGIQVMVYTPDRLDLFEQICSYFYEQRIDILDARIHTTRQGYALDSFVVDSAAIDADIRSNVPLIEHGLRNRLNTPLPAQNEPLTLKSNRYVVGANVRRSRTFPLVPLIELLPDENSQYWRLSITAMDSPGILYALANTFKRHQINLQMAKVMTLGDRVEDIFILGGNALDNPRTQMQFKRDLLTAINNLTAQK